MGLLYRDSFYDGGYSESTIHDEGCVPDELRLYIDSSQAERLSSFLDGLAGSGVDRIFVHCYYGESRSGAIALYLQNRHGFTPNKPIQAQPNSLRVAVQPNQV